MSEDWRSTWNIRKRKKTDGFFKRTGKRMALSPKKKAEDTRPVPVAMLLPHGRDFVLMEKKVLGSIGSAMTFMPEMMERLGKKIHSDPETGKDMKEILSVQRRNIIAQESGTVMKSPLS